MDDDVLATNLRRLTRKSPARRLGRQPQWPVPQDDDLQETLRCLHEAYADDDEVPDHLERLARRVADAYLWVEDDDDQQRPPRLDG